MKANVTIENIWFNASLRGFFFRDQSFNTLEALVNKSGLSAQETLEHLDSYYNDYDLDDFEEMCYSESVQYIADDCGLTLANDDENE